MLLTAPAVPRPMGTISNSQGTARTPALTSQVTWRREPDLPQGKRFPSAAACPQGFALAHAGRHHCRQASGGQGRQGPETGAWGRQEETTQVTRAPAGGSLSPAAGQPCTLGAGATAAGARPPTLGRWETRRSPPFLSWALWV